MLCAVTLLALLASAQGRAVNISNTWVLPEEGFPVFYRYFRDRISWYEADAVCQFHHANLVTVDTTAQYDAVRAYLKELDISSAVWVGLIRSNPDGDFTWTDYRGLSGEGYWSSAPDGRTAPLCAAANPAADYRWEARACGGPTVASFICELPVPQWALGNEGCMVRELPALTILYLPESAAVQLTADCGMAGVKRVQCTGNVKRESLLKELSCNDEEEELTSSSSVSITGITWPLTSTDSIITDQDVTNDITTEENLTTEVVKQLNITQSTPIPYVLNTVADIKFPIKGSNLNKFNKVLLEKNYDINTIHSNNMQSNDIPKIAVESNYLTEEQLDKIEDEKNMRHKMIHEEFAKHGNYDNIFTQPTDHFVPPLVMAKAKISDDMTVLSIEEKHAQQLVLHNLQRMKDKTTTEKPTSENITVTSDIVLKTISIYKETNKKDTAKNVVPKKYNEKYNDSKNKIFKASELKNNKGEKLVELSTQPTSTVKIIETTPIDKINSSSSSDELDDTLDLKVIIKDDPIEVHQVDTELPNYSGDITKLEVLLNDSYQSHEKPVQQVSPIPVQTTEETEHKPMIHEVINITIISETKSTSAPIVFEITTKVPALENDVSQVGNFSTPSPYEALKFNRTTDSPINTSSSTITNSYVILNITSDATLIPTKFTSAPTDTTESTTTAHTTSAKNIATVSTTGAPETTTVIYHNVSYQVPQNYSENTVANINSSTENALYIENDDMELDHNSTDSTIDDFQSPLLSAASEPVHRPNRSRRPQQPNRTNKFNPFRILG